MKLDIKRLIPFALRLLREAPKIQHTVSLTDPAVAEFKKVWPEVGPLVRDVIERCKRISVLLGPTIEEVVKVYPELKPAVLELRDTIWPEIAAQWRRDTMLPALSVRWLQESLTRLGHKVKADGLMGPETEKAVRAFQKKAGLEVDGWAGLDTVGAIVRALEALDVK